MRPQRPQRPSCSRLPSDSFQRPAIRTIWCRNCGASAIPTENSEIIQEYSEKDCRPHPVVVKECPEALLPFPVPDQGVMVEHQDEGAEKPCIVIASPFEKHPDPGENGEHDSVADHDRQQVEPPESDGRSPDAYPEIVFPVDERIFGVVGDGPEDVREQNDPGDFRNMTRFRSECHRNAESECDAEIGLGDREKALREGIAQCQEKSGEGKQDGGAVGEQDEQEGGERKKRRQEKRFPFRDLSRCKRPVPGALDMGVNIHVGIVVHDASRGSHQYRAEHEHEEEQAARMAV